MERIKLLVLSLVCFLFLGGSPASADPVQNLSTLVTPQNVSFEDCTRTFNMDPQRLFYLTIAAVNANRFEIKEVQAKTGYVLFAAVGKDFLASVISIDKYRSMLKVTPANNNYFFAPGIVMNIYKYVEVNATEDLKTIQKIED